MPARAPSRTGLPTRRTDTTGASNYTLHAKPGTHRITGSDIQMDITIEVCAEAGLKAAQARLEAAIKPRNTEVMFAALAETLMWIASLDEFYQHRSSNKVTYLKKKDKSPVAAVI